MRFEVLMTVKMSMLVLQVVMLCGLVGRYQCLRGTFSLKMQAVCSRKMLVSTTSPHDIATLKTNMDNNSVHHVCVVFNSMFLTSYLKRLYIIDLIIN
jgi:hypothetical protein